MNLIPFIEAQREWSARTFGETPRAEGLLAHIAKECEEIRAEPSKLSEWCDIIILAIDGAWRQGYSPEMICDALEKKQAVNFTRVYNVGAENEPCEHVRGGE